MNQTRTPNKPRLEQEVEARVGLVQNFFSTATGGGADRSHSIFGLSWSRGAKLAAAAGIAYFVAGRLGLALRAEPGMAVFWPAAGIAVGALVALGSRMRLPLAFAVFIASAACSLTIGRNAWLTIAFAFLNVGQALITGWLLEHWFGKTFKLDDVQRVLGFIAATTIGSAIGAAGAMVAVGFIERTASAFHVWGVWFGAASLGIVTVAPLLIGLGDAMRARLSRHELMEGWAGLVALAALTVFLISLPDGPWASALPEAMVFPLLLWIATRCRPVFAAGAALVVGLMVIGSATLNVGYFDSGKPLADRILSAQTFVFIESILVVLLAAVFAERRQVAERLQLALDGAVLGAFRADLATGKFACDMRAAQFQGHCLPPTTIQESSRFVHPEDLGRIDDAIAKAQDTGGNWKVEYRVVPPPGHPHAGETRWVAVEGSIVTGAHGAPVQLFGVTRDVTGHKLAEQALAERDAQLALAGRAALVGAYAYDVETETVQISEGYAAIFKFPEGTTELPRSQWQARMHPEDRERAENLRKQVFRERRGEYNVEYRVVVPDRGLRWLEARTFISYDGNGHPRRVVGVNIDVTERRRAEERQSVLVAELDHRVKNVLASVSAVVSNARYESGSLADFVATLDGRIRSMATTHELLSAGRWQGIALAELVRRELAPYATRNNTSFNGPEVLLKPEAGQAIAMVLHELVTNAAKYGALSTKNGHVEIWWDRQPNGHARSQLVLEWQEIGGPPVISPGEPNYGTSTIRDLIPYEFGGSVDLVFASDGVLCRLELPADWISDNGEPERT
jgi:PAS domain S-box-containing protein